MTKTQIRKLIQDNAGRPYYVYGLFWPGGNCFYVGKGQKERIFQHDNGGSHNDEVNRLCRILRNQGKSPDYEIFTFALTERQALTIETDYQKRYLSESKIANRVAGTKPIEKTTTFEDKDRWVKKRELIRECDELIDELQIETTLRPSDTSPIGTWESFYKDVIEPNKIEDSLHTHSMKTVYTPGWNIIRSKTSNLFTIPIPSIFKVNQLKLIQSKYKGVSHTIIGFNHVDVENPEEYQAKLINDLQEKPFHLVYHETNNLRGATEIVFWHSLTHKERGKLLERLPEIYTY